MIIPQLEERSCSGHSWPFVTLTGGVSLIPLDRDFLLLIDGDQTTPATDFEFTLPRWLSELAGCFSRSAYIEAEIWGGTGMQACVVLEQRGTVSEPLISSGAINFALRRMGIDDGSSISFCGLSVPTGKDPFDVVGLGRHGSVADWLKDCAEPCAPPNGGPAAPVDNPHAPGGPPSVS